MALMAAILFFAVYVSNVALGALASSAFMGDVGEMVTLLAASICFVAAILKAEATQKE